MISSGGGAIRSIPPEVENVLYDLPCVAESGIIKVPDPSPERR